MAATRRHVALVGLPGTGKSTIGPVLAARLGVRHVDIDAEVERRAGKTISELFLSDGEAVFRDAELLALEAAVTDPTPAVIACGGGLFAAEAARTLLAGTATSVWLDAPDPVLLGRLGNAADRPLLMADPAGEMRRRRASRAAAHAQTDHRVDASGDVGTVITRVLAAIGEGDVWVEVPGRRYPVVIGPGAAEAIEHRLPAGARRVAVIADRAVAPLAMRLALAIRRSGRAAATVFLEGGEPAKSWAVAGRVLRRLARAGLSRDDCVLAVGGGTVGDLAGFVAAVYMRGIAVIQVPTTLLAMIDSAIGGKTAVNLPAGKNLAGVVWQPHAVVCDLETLATLPVRARRAACSEIIKTAMIADAGLATTLDAGMDALLAGDVEVTSAIVRRCIGVKARIVAADEHELGRRALLNYGHTVGHAVETLAKGSVWHGEAVAVGMRAAGLLSVRFNGCPPQDIRWQNTMLDRAGLDLRPRLDPDAVVAGTAVDKKSSGGRVRWVLVDRLGAATSGHALAPGDVRHAVAEVLDSR